MSALPRAVQQQVDRANAILNKMKSAATDTPPITPPPATDTPPITPPPATDTPPITPPPADTPPAAPQTTDTPSAEQPPVTDTAPADDTWQHKYSVLQGKYNAEVPRLRSQLTDQNSLLQEMRQRLNNAETTIASLHAVRQQPADPSPTPKPMISDEEVQTFGSDLIDVMRRAAREEASRLIAAGVKPVADKVERIEKTASHASQSVAESKQQETLRLLGEAVPDWKQLNTDGEFLGWLDQVDPYTGQKRGVLLRIAFQANDATRVIAFFQGYLKENAAVKSGLAPSTPPTQSKEPQTKIADMVAPGAPKNPTASAPNDAGKRVWTQKDVAALYARKNEFIRRFPGKEMPDELAKLEKDLFKAQHEGRIRG